jgi:hypothetical protein
LLTEQEFATVREIVLKRIRETAREGLFWSVSDPAGLLWSWWAMGENDEASVWITEQIKDPKHALSLMKSMPTLVRSSNGNYRAVQKASWRHMVDLDDLSAKASLLSKDQTLSDVERATAEEFLKAMECKSMHLT